MQRLNEYDTTDNGELLKESEVHVIECHAIAALRRDVVKLNRAIESFGGHYESVWRAKKTCTILPRRKSAQDTQTDISAIRREMANLLNRLGTLADSYPDLF